jgi:hypothetical protein
MTKTGPNNGSRSGELEMHVHLEPGTSSYFLFLFSSTNDYSLNLGFNILGGHVKLRNGMRDRMRKCRRSGNGGTETTWLEPMWVSPSLKN